MNVLKTGIIGFGVVGSGSVAGLIENHNEITRRSGHQIIIQKITTRNLAKLSEKFTKKQIAKNWQEVVEDPEIEVIVELVGGETVAKEIILTAIANGKHIVTANKALIAKYGNEIFAKAAEKKVMVAYEAAVAGGIPIIKALRETLSGNQILEVKGIINGTCNYILSAMYQHNQSFEQALSAAQKLGYAEADPTFDIKGVDAQHKLAILGGLAFGIPIQLDKVYLQGISKLEKIDIEYADKLGYRIKLLAIARRAKTETHNSVELRVHPTLIPKRQMLANVEGVMNAVEVTGDRVGKLLFYGAGAGANPTGSAIISDLVDIARDVNSNYENRVPYLAFLDKHLSSEPVLAIDEVVSSFYIRLQTIDQAGVLAQITTIFAESNISIDSVLQYEREDQSKNSVNLILLTHETREGNLAKAIDKIESLPSVIGKSITIRREH